MDGSVETNESKIYGWINVADKTDWDTRVALEDAHSKEAKDEYSTSKLNGYITQNEITTCVEENLCDSKKSIAQFSVGPTRNNVMRRPVISNIDHNIKKVISIAKDNKGNKVYEALLTEARRLQSNVNIVFVLDATASMRPYYKSIANSLEKVIDNNQKIIKSNLKLGVVVYRDYADGKSAYDVQPLTTDFNKVKKVIKIEGKGSDLKIKLESKNNNTIKLKMIKGDEPDYENMFGLLVYSGNEPSSPKLLESTIENTLKEYMLSISNNINILENYVRTGGPTGSEPPEGLIIYMMDVLKCSREEAKDHLRKTEFTVQAYVAIDYYGNGVDAQVPVVLLTEGEKNNLVKSLRKLTEGVYASAELKKVFQDNIIYICKSIIGQNTSTETIENLSLNQIWNIILGVDFGNKKMKKMKLNELTGMKKKDFKRFYKDFEMVAKEFCDESYVHTDPLINRRFDIGGSYLFWVPLEDLPGCKIK